MIELRHILILECEGFPPFFMVNNLRCQTLGPEFLAVILPKVRFWI